MKIKNTINRLKVTSEQLQEDIFEANRMKNDWLRSDLMTAYRSLNLTIKNLETALENLNDYSGTSRQLTNNTHTNTL